MGEVLLSVCQFAAARVVYSEERHDAVDYEQFKDARLIVELQKFCINQIHMRSTFYYVVDNREIGLGLNVFSV